MLARPPYVHSIHTFQNKCFTALRVLGERKKRLQNSKSKLKGCSDNPSVLSARSTASSSRVWAKDDCIVSQSGRRSRIVSFQNAATGCGSDASGCPTAERRARLEREARISSGQPSPLPPSRLRQCCSAILREPAQSTWGEGIQQDHSLPNSLLQNRRATG